MAHHSLIFTNFFSFLTVILLIPSSVAQAAASLKHFYLDDTDPSVSYTAQTDGRWYAIDATNPMEGCPDAQCLSLTLNSSQAIEGTWHEGDGEVTMTWNFTGVQFVVYGFINDVPEAFTNLDFTVDGGAFASMAGPGKGTGWKYSELYAGSGLTNGQHQVVMTQRANSTIVIDAFTYDQPQNAAVNPSNSSSPSSPPTPSSSTFATGAPSNSKGSTTSTVAIGVIVTILILVAVVAGAFLYRRYLQQQKKHIDDVEVQVSIDTLTGPLVLSPTPYTIGLPSESREDIVLPIRVSTGHSSKSSMSSRRTTGDPDTRMPTFGSSMSTDGASAMQIRYSRDSVGAERAVFWAPLAEDPRLRRVTTSAPPPYTGASSQAAPALPHLPPIPRLPTLSYLPQFRAEKGRRPPSGRV